MDRPGGNLRQLLRWVVACGGCVITLVVVWLVGHLWLHRSTGNVLTVGSLFAGAVLVALAWWAPLKPATGEAPATGLAARVSVSGDVDGTVVAGNNNTIYSSATLSAGQPESAGVGDGAGSRRPKFVELHAQAGGEAVLGRPRATGSRAWGGYVQFFDLGDARSYVLWLPADGAGVVMPESVWDALCAVGDPQREADWPNLAGLPAMPGSGYLMIDDRTLEIPLAGGSWQGGRLIRDDPGAPWFWQPEPRQDDQTAHFTMWDRDSGYEVRIRAIVDMAWHGPPNLSSTEGYRDNLLAAAAAGRFANVFNVLGSCYGVDLVEPTWDIAQSNNNWARGVHITASLTNSAGQPAIRADVMLQAPALAGARSLLGCIDVHINLSGLVQLLHEAGASDVEPRLSLLTLLRLLDIEIEDAGEVLPGLVTSDPDHVRFVTPPFVATRVQTGQFGVGNPPQYLTLSEVLDLSPFGDPTKDQGYQEMAIRIVGARGQDRGQRRRLLLDGLMSYAFGWGFTRANRAQVEEAVGDWQAGRVGRGAA
jgi:hypothetical protein